MVDVEVAARPDGGALIGAMIAAGFGVAWTLWGASGLPSAASGPVGIAGIVVALIILLSCVRLLRSAPSTPPQERSGSMFSSKAFIVIAVVEVLAIRGGVVVLGARHEEYVIAWVAIVVGAHFLAFGRLFWAGFYWLGTALVTAGILGTALGFAGASSGTIKAVTGLLVAACLFAAGGATVASPRSPSHV